MKNQNGFTLIEIMIATAIGAVLVLLIASIVNFGMLGQKGVDNMANASEFATEIKQLMWQQNLCTENMKVLFPGAVAIGQSQKITRLSPIEKLANGSYQLQVNQPALIEVGNAVSGKRSGVALSEVEFLIRQRITDKFYIGSVNMTFSHENASVGARSVARSFPIAIGVNAGNFAYCGALDSSDGLALNDKICEIATNGEDYWDGTECKSRFEYQDFPGVDLDASCPPVPAGDTPWLISSCRIDNVVGGPVTQLPSRRLKGGMRPLRLQDYTIDTSTNSCACDLAVGATGNCIAVCKRQIVF